MDTLYPDLYRRILRLLDVEDWLYFRYTCKDIYNSVTVLDIQDKMKELIKLHRTEVQELRSLSRRYVFYCPHCNHPTHNNSILECKWCLEQICYECFNEDAFTKTGINMDCDTHGVVLMCNECYDDNICKLCCKIHFDYCTSTCA